MDNSFCEEIESRRKRIGERIKAERKRVGLTQEEFAERLTVLLGCDNIAQNTISNWEKGSPLPSTEKIIAMSRIFGCDCGYLLCDYEQRTHNSTEMCKETGLSERSIQILCNNNKWGFTKETRVIDFLLLDTVERNSKHHFRPILNLLHFFFGYKNDSKIRKAVSIHGFVYDNNSTDGMIDANSISISSRVIENAVLMEIQQALISIKQNYVQWSDEGDAKRHG